MEKFVVTIARGMGSGGSHIAKALSARLGIPYYDEDILHMASDLSGINIKYFFESNEKIHKGQMRINASNGIYSGELFDANDSRFLSDENLFNYEARVIKDLAISDSSGSCIVLGKAANRLIGSLKNVLTVNIQAPLPYCVKTIMERKAMNAGEAERLILTTDKYRSNYYKYYMGGEWLNPKEYDLTINTQYTGEEFATELIVECLIEKGLLKEVPEDEA